MGRHGMSAERSPRAQTLPTQKVGATVGCKVIDVLTGLGMPISRRVVWTRTGMRERHLHADFCTDVTRRAAAAFNL